MEELRAANCSGNGAKCVTSLVGGGCDARFPLLFASRPVCSDCDAVLTLDSVPGCVRSGSVSVRFSERLEGIWIGFPVDWAGVAQLVEHLICNQRVGGSNPFASSTLERPQSGL
jgi:hypothetical protein